MPPKGKEESNSPLRSRLIVVLSPLKFWARRTIDGDGLVVLLARIARTDADFAKKSPVAVTIPLTRPMRWSRKPLSTGKVLGARYIGVPSAAVAIWPGVGGSWITVLPPDALVTVVAGAVRP